MELLNHPILLYIVLVFMLLGAYLLGYLMSHRRYSSDMDINYKISTKKIEPQDPLQNKATSYSKDPKPEKIRTKLSDLDGIGTIRATKTRERSGELSTMDEKDDHKSIARETLDFAELGMPDKEHPQDLTSIKGINQEVQNRLNEAGIFQYNQIALLKDNDIQILHQITRIEIKRIHDDKWVQQARELSKKNTP